MISKIQKTDSKQGLSALLLTKLICASLNEIVILHKKTQRKVQVGNKRMDIKLFEQEIHSPLAPQYLEKSVKEIPDQINSKSCYDMKYMKQFKCKYLIWDYIFGSKFTFKRLLNVNGMRRHT